MFGRQRRLFDDSPPDLWATEQLRRLAENGTFWTPEGPCNGHYEGPPEQEAEPPREPCRARPRTGRPRKQVLA